jgi:formate dehydrogenase accessory protein FdhD
MNDRIDERFIVGELRKMPFDITKLETNFEEIYSKLLPFRIYTAIKENIPQDVTIANEFTVSLKINNKFHIFLHTTPRLIPELILGYLYGEFFIEKTEAIDAISVKLEDDIAKIEIHLKNMPDLKNKQFELRTSGQYGFLQNPFLDSEPILSDISIKRETIFSAQQLLLEKMTSWNLTGGTHMAGLFFKDGRPICLCEDIARHNTIDKIVGAGLRNNVDFGDTFAIISGRLSASMVNKIIRAKIPILASRAAPLSGGIDRAISANLTLIGFVRRPEFNIYSNPKRIIS